MNKKTLVIVIIILLIAVLIAVMVLINKDEKNRTPSAEPSPEEAVLVQNEDGSIELPEDAALEERGENDKYSDDKKKSPADSANSTTEQGETTEDIIE